MNQMELMTDERHHDFTALDLRNKHIRHTLAPLNQGSKSPFTLTLSGRTYEDKPVKSTNEGVAVDTILMMDVTWVKQSEHHHDDEGEEN